MFTGIIREVGTVIAVERARGGLRLSVRSVRTTRRVRVGSSVAVAGVCLTVVRRTGPTLIFDIMPETLRKTTLERLSVGSKVNIEPSLRLGDELGGHLVSGHVDGVGVVQAVRRVGHSKVVVIRTHSLHSRILKLHGSVAVDGVSLTVARKARTTFTVALVPYTLRQTTLHLLTKGSRINIEVDRGQW